MEKSRQIIQRFMNLKRRVAPILISILEKPILEGESVYLDEGFSFCILVSVWVYITLTENNAISAS